MGIISKEIDHFFETLERIFMDKIGVKIRKPHFFSTSHYRLHLYHFLPCSCSDTVIFSVLYLQQSRALEICCFLKTAAKLCLSSAHSTSPATSVTAQSARSVDKPDRYQEAGQGSGGMTLQEVGQGSDVMTLLG